MKNINCKRSAFCLSYQRCHSILSENELTFRFVCEGINKTSKVEKAGIGDLGGEGQSRSKCNEAITE